MNVRAIAVVAALMLSAITRTAASRVHVNQATWEMVTTAQVGYISSCQLVFWFSYFIDMHAGRLVLFLLVLSILLAFIVCLLSCASCSLSATIFSARQLICRARYRPTLSPIRLSVTRLDQSEMVEVRIM